jgi:hypothetical protein
MGIIDSIIRSKNDLVKPKSKSYWGYSLNIKLIDVKEFREKKSTLPSEERALEHELSETEPAEQVILIDNQKKSLGRLTTNQIKDILDDLGFNVDVLMSASHFSDFSAVMNIRGYSLPLWNYLANGIAKIFPQWEKLLLLKLAPGKERLHIRVFELNSGSWFVAAHTDYNWININPFEIHKAHIQIGTGNYHLGTLMMYTLLKRFAEFTETNKVMPVVEIKRITEWSYHQSSADKLSETIQ